MTTESMMLPVPTSQHRPKSTTRWFLSAVFFLAILGVALCGCDNGEKKEKSESTKKERKPVAELFPDEQPSIPPPARGIEWGMTGEEVSSAVPEMEGEFGASMDLDDYGFRMAIAPSFSFPTNDAEPRVESIDLLMYDKDLEAVVVEQWGKPTEISVSKIDLKSDDLGYRQVPGSVWFSNDGIRALATPEDMFEDMVNLEFTPYITADELVGTGDGVEPAMTEGWLGSSLQELRKSNPGGTFGDPGTGSDGATDVSFSLPLFYQWGSSPIDVLAEEKEGQVVGYRLRLSPFGSEQAEPVLDAFEARFGSPADDRFDEKLRVYRSEDPAVSVRYDEEQHKLSVYVGDISTFF